MKTKKQERVFFGKVDYQNLKAPSYLNQLILALTTILKFIALRQVFSGKASTNKQALHLIKHIQSSIRSIQGNFELNEIDLVLRSNFRNERFDKFVSLEVCEEQKYFLVAIAIQNVAKEFNRDFLELVEIVGKKPWVGNRQVIPEDLVNSSEKEINWRAVSNFEKIIFHALDCPKSGDIM
ncbi:MAG TPA: hypothetical protein VGE63_00690 [Candidatus Paceibacterota bacterium]